MLTVKERRQIRKIMAYALGTDLAILAFSAIANRFAPLVKI